MADLGVGLSVGVAGWLLTYLLYSSLALGAAWLLVATRTVRSPTARERLWKSAVLAGLVAAFGQSVAEQARAPEDLSERHLRVVDVHRVVGPPHLGLGDVDEADRRGSLGRTSTGRVRAITARVTNPRAACRGVLRVPGGSLDAKLDAARTLCAAGPFALWYLVVLALWGLGALVGVLRMYSAHRSLRGAVAGRRDVRRGAAREALNDLRVSVIGPRRIRLTVSEGLESPALLNQGEICLPPRALELPPREIQVVMAHELGHLVRRDPLWTRLIEVVEAVFFIQPLNRLARRELRDASEFLCDDWAVQHTGSPLTLARSLARVAEWLSCPAPEPAPSIVRSNDGRLVKRVERILEPHAVRRPMARRASALVPLFFLMLAAVPPVRVSAPTSIRIETRMTDAPIADVDALRATLDADAPLSSYMLFVERSVSVRP